MLQQLLAPYIPLEIEVEKAIVILNVLGQEIVLSDDESLRVDTPSFSVAVYPEDGKVKSVWFDDPLGRESSEGIE